MYMYIIMYSILYLYVWYVCIYHMEYIRKWNMVEDEVDIHIFLLIFFLEIFKVHV